MGKFIPDVLWEPVAKAVIKGCSNLSVRLSVVDVTHGEIQGGCVSIPQIFLSASKQDV